MKVRIYKPHTHAGVLYNPGPEGIELTVSQAVADFLKSAGVLEGPQPTAPDTDHIVRIIKSSGDRRTS